MFIARNLLCSRQKRGMESIRKLAGKLTRKGLPRSQGAKDPPAVKLINRLVKRRAY